MAWLTSQHSGGRPSHHTGRGHAWRSAAGILTAALGLSMAAGLASAGGAAAGTCPAGTVLYRNACIVIGFPIPTPTSAPPVTTPPTTAAPLVQLPPVTAPPVLAPILTPATPQVAAGAAQRLLDLVNGERRSAGLSGLTSRDDIVDIAIAHSQEMAQKGDIFHSDSFFASAVKNLLNAAVRGENVAYNGDIDNTHARLMASAGHRANILDPRFSAVGIGVVLAPDGRYFVTQDFIQPAGAPPATRPSAASRAAAPAVPRKAAVTATPAPAPAPPENVTAPPTTVATPPRVETPEVAHIDTVSSAVSATSPAPGHPVMPLATATVLLMAAMAASCIVPRRTWA